MVNSKLVSVVLAMWINSKAVTVGDSFHLYKVMDS